MSKLLFYSPVHLMHGGGCERWHMDVLQILKKKHGHEVRLITGDFGGQDIPKAEVDRRLKGVEYTIVKTRKAWGGLARVPDKEAQRVVEEAVEWADAVHFIFGFFGQDSMMKNLKKKYGTKIVAGIHAPIFYENKMHNLYVKYYSRYFTMPHFDGFMALNPGEHKILKNWGFNKAVFIPSGVDVNKFSPKPTARKSGQLSILWAGRFEIQKAPDLAAAGINNFLQKTKGADVKFTFIGSGSMQNYIEDLAKKYPKNIDLVGYTTKPTGYFQATDLFFLPSRQEPFGLVVVEAMATGAPVLASKTEGPTLMIKEGKNGWFFSELTPKGIALLLSEVYAKWQKDEKIFSKMQSTLRESAEKYSIEASVEKMNRKFFS